MKTVLQRVSQASVTVEETITGQIDRGILVLVGFEKGDNTNKLDYHLKKLCNIRIFPDEAGKMNRSVKDINGAILVVSQFTLAGDCRKGTRPSFDQALPPAEAESLYNTFVRRLREESELQVETGIFAAMMQVALVNDGPVTLLLEN